MVKQCEYKWMGGDLKVVVEGVSAWGSRTFKVPTFDKYMEGLRADRGKYATSSQYSNNYYDYIRSPGSLSWVTEDGKDSTEVICNQAQQLSQFLAGPSDNTSGTPTASSVTSTYPTAKCQYAGSKYPKDRVQGIINAARAGGISSKAGFAGVVGNALAESTTRLDPGISNFEGSGAFGIFQWLGSRRRDLEAHARGLGKNPSDFNAQMSWFVKELQGADFAGPSTVQQLNQSNDPTAAAFIFGTKFERALIDGIPNTLQGRAKRESFAREIFNDLNCT
jgi:hypothetical protein